jgi:Ala-tRNA(Pro) deacylase
MTIPSRLKDHLEQTHTQYSQVLHAPARSSQYAASLIHVPGKEVAKTVVVRAGDKVLLAVLPASYHVNLEKLASCAGAPARLMEEDEFFKLFPDCQPGAVPPFGELYGLPVYLDKALSEDSEIVVSAGTLSEGIRVRTSDFVNLVQPRVCSFADRGEVTRRKSMENDLTKEWGGGK